MSLVCDDDEHAGRRHDAAQPLMRAESFLEEQRRKNQHEHGRGFVEYGGN